ncbi:MAG: hypothetical protein IJW70_09720 [Clostridia bacterium]|nr:hypothetical protein [Clostridia bacterium]
MRSLKIAFSVLLCVTILSVGASVVCAVIAGNTAESFRDYRSSVITALSSLHAQLNSSKQAFAEALTYLEGEQNTEQQTEPATESMTEEQQSAAQTEQDSANTDVMKDPQTTPESTAPTALFTVRKVDGRIGIYDANGVLLRTLNVSVATLPRADRELLEVGIVLCSQEELDALIEDYSG